MVSLLRFCTYLLVHYTVMPARYPPLQNTPFSPDMIASHFLQVFIVVQPLPGGNERGGGGGGGDRYRVSVTRRVDVPDFPPALPQGGIFEAEDEEAFGEWLLAKCINAEHACFGTRKLSEMQTRTRATLFEVRSRCV